MVTRLTPGTPLGSVICVGRLNFGCQAVVKVRASGVPLASVRACDYRQVSQEGRLIQALLGTNLAGESVHLFPGEVPARCPDARYWQGENQFGFVALRPPHLLPDQAMPHLRLDQVLEFLLGDKLR